ncbi:glycosyltransferase family 4 protein [Demequina sp.]|uniref:glycosyltransferase family 4 protein n=1 Tax=Demequina sp. TaxID=2050685 RepID=UPI0025C6A184|nr:glycosyltransferase family 4 protein [Demequina sp.]
MRVVIVSRIYSPEVSAASGFLQAWAEEFRDRGCDVTVITTKPPRGAVLNDVAGVKVRRAPVIRDKQQYVRGYIPYLSFDVPLVLRLLFSRRPDLYVVEPPPTTTAVVIALGTLRRTPVVVDAADLWSDAAAMVSSNRLVLTALRRLERWGLKRARHLFVAHAPLATRFRELGIETPSTPVGNGADTDVFRYAGEPAPTPPLFVYAGTHSEWHGAGVFVEAFVQVLDQHPDARLLFIGNGADRQSLRERADALGIGDSVEMRTPISRSELAPILAGATVSLASLKPGQGYDYAFTTKVYSSLAAGCPVIFTGTGPTVDFLNNAENPDAGVALEYNVDATAAAMSAAAASPLAPAARAELAQWAASRYSLRAIAIRVVDESLAIIGK